MSSRSPKDLERAISSGSMPEILSQLYPGLARYCPILHSLSPQQNLLLTWKGKEVLYGGAVGGGKSAGLLAAALRFIHRPGYRALLLRRTYAELAKGEGLIPLSHEWLGPSDARWNEQRKTWTFPSGATIEFGHVQHEEDKHAYQGAAYAFVGFDELTHFTETIYAYIGLSRQRRRRSLSDIPVQTYATANPGGVGHLWVRKRFIDPPADPEAPKLDRFFIPAKLRDNPGLDAEEYELRLQQLPPALRAQLADGDWGAFEGAAYQEFDAEKHVVPIFTVPPQWERFECMDHGLSAPTAWHIVATDHDGNLVVFDTYYGYDQRGVLVHEHAAAVLKRRVAWYPQWIEPSGRVMRHHPYTIADPAVMTRTSTTRRNGSPATIATEYLDQSNEEIVLVPGNNDPVAGMARIKELLRIDPDRRFPEWHPRAGEHGSPRLFIVHHCRDLIEQIAAAPLLSLESGKRDAGEKVDTDWEGQYGHAHAALRYGVMSRPQATPPIAEVPDDPRTLAFMEYEARRDSDDRPRRRATVPV